jgi:queuosine precursor transporter
MNSHPEPGQRYFAVIAATFVATLLISNIAAQKLIPMGPFVFTGGILLFPVTYIFGDILTEVYGYARTRQIIWAGFGANVLMASFLGLVVALPPAPGWPLQEAFASALGLVPRIVAASIIAYWIGEFANSFVLAKLKVRTEGKHLWARTISSTLVGQALDTVVFVFAAFGGVLPNSLLVRTTWSGYLFKVFYEVVATPLTYFIVGRLKRAEGVDVYDRKTRFTPFSLRPE